MIYFMEYSSGGMRGGELYNAHFHEFISSRFEVLPDKIQSFPKKMRNPVRHAINNLKLVKEKRPDMIVFDISSGIRNLLAQRWIKKNNKISLLIIQEERLNLRWGNFLNKWIIRKVEEYIVRRSDIFVVNSHYSANLARKKGAPSDAPIIIAHPGLENVVKSAEINTKTIGNSKELFELLYVGVCNKHKGIIDLVKAIARLSNYDIRLNIIGHYDADSRYYKKIRNFIKRNNLENSVKFLGFVERDKLLEMYMNSQLYVHPSIMEGYGMVLAEAMSFGLPIVSTTAGAIPELVEDGVNGILVNPKSPQELTLAIEFFYKDEGLRKTISLNNLKKIEKLPTWDDFNKTLEKELVPVISAHTPLAGHY